MDRIEIRGVRAFGYHGVLEEERRRGQTFVVDLILEGDLSAAETSDALEDTVDYAALSERVAAEVEATRFDLIEALAGRLAQVALDDPTVHAVTVRVAKPHAPLTVDADEVAVVVRRTRPTP
jgi:dihydroneopterin aldolase